MKKHKILKCVLLILLGIIVVVALLVGAFLLFWPSLGKNPTKEQQEEYAERTDAFYDGVFHTPEFFELMVPGVEATSTDGVELEPIGEIPVHKLTELADAAEDDLTFTWFGHSTSIMQIHGMNVFIDPVLSEYSSPVSFVGAKRMAEVPMVAEDIPEIDILLLSHDHYDHLDYQTIMDMDHKVNNYVVPLGVDNHLIRWGVDPEKIHTMAWWEETEIDGLKIASTPGQHYSGRFPWESNTTLWSGYVLQDDYHKVYYTGDTGYGEFFKEVQERYGTPDLMISEDGQYDSQWAYCHMAPEEVLQAAEDMGTQWLIPVHWAGFVLSRHAWADPVIRLTEAAENANVSIATPEIGQTMHFSEIANYQNKWWESVK